MRIASGRAGVSYLGAMVMMGNDEAVRNDEAVQLESFPVADVAEVETMLRCTRLP